MTEDTARHLELIETLSLRPHPEGGYFGEVHRTTSMVSDASTGLERSAGTAIYFLLGAGEFSHWHVVRWDEVWHHYEGSPLELMTVDPQRMTLETRLLGPAGDDQKPILSVRGGHWQAARPLGGFTLAGCTVSPGFEFEDMSFVRDDASSHSRLARHFPSLLEYL